jgi:signal peptidase II
MSKLFCIRRRSGSFRWFKILFIENEGMAWGTEIPGTYGKISNTI